MPWKASDAKKHTAKATTAAMQKRWAAVANAALAKCTDEGGEQDACEASAIKQANAVVAQNEKADVEETRVELGEMLRGVRDWMDQFYAALSAMQGYGDRGLYVRDVLVGHPELGNAVIVQSGAALLAVPYMTDGEAGVTLAGADEWRQVVMTYQAVEAGDAAEPAGDAEPEEADVTEAEPGTAGDLTDQVGHAVRLVEAGDVATGGATPLLLEVVPIAPGWGNRRDNYYYDRPVLEECSPRVFSEVKMFETDHVESEKSTRTWVSTVLDFARFGEGGEPVVRVGVHDPGFAARLLNLHELGILHLMECSIVAAGTARKGFERDGRRGSYVESIEEVRSLDWVTRAGARGRAVGLAEAEGGGSVTDEQRDQGPQEGNMVEGEPEAPAESVTIHEEEGGDPDPEPLAAARVGELLDGSGLPQVARVRLEGRSWESEAALREAIGAEAQYVRTLSEAGRPFAQGAAAPAAREVSAEEREYQGWKEFNQVMREAGIAEVPLPAHLRHVEGRAENAG